MKARHREGMGRGAQRGLAPPCRVARARTGVPGSWGAQGPARGLPCRGSHSRHT